jgi:hypothetical protein
VHQPAGGPSGPASVVLDLGPGIGALVLHTPPELDGREIEVSRQGPAPAGRTHAQVRPRKTASQTQHAAIYPQLPAGTYTIWKDHLTPAATVTIHSGQVTTARWPEPPQPRHRPNQAHTSPSEPPLT